MTSRATLRVRGVGAGLLLTALLSACGSTVQVTAPTTGGDALGAETASPDGLSVSPGGASTLPGPDSAAGGTALGSSPTSQAGSAPGATAGGPAGAPSSAGSGAAPAVSLAHAPGVTAKTITVGFPYAPNSDQAQAALGNSAVTQGNPRRVAEALIAEINRGGGIAGRELKAVFHEVDAASAETADQRAQGLCDTFIEDNKVFAVLAATSPLLRDCLGKAGILNINGSIAELNEANYRASPHYYDTTALSLDTLSRSLVAQLTAQRYFQPWDNANGQPGGALPVKLGILVPDKPAWLPVVKNVLLPALRAAGHPVAPENVKIWHFPESAAGNGQAVTEIQSTVLRFRSDNVTHVLPMEQNSLAFFTSAAEGQGYRPRYGLSSAAGAQGYGGSLVPYRQLHGAVGVGWLPAIDLPAAAQTAAYNGPGRKRCLDLMTRAEINYGSDTEKAIALLLCDVFFSLEAAVEALPPGSAVNVKSFMSALERLGATFRIAGLPSGGFGPGRHYPVTHGYAYAFSIPCQCMTYSGARYALQ